VKNFPLLTVGELIKTLKTYDPNMLVAIELGGFSPPQTTTVLSTLGYVNGDFYIKKSQRVHREYYMGDELPPEKKSDFVKCLILNAHATKEEVADSGL